MATSPNYGWLEPDNTDLVKNGALSIRTLGNAIDTTMATMTPKSTYTAKGSIAAASAASTPANLSVGTNGSVLVADSSQTTGLGWTATPAASNPVLNSAMQVWQRGTSFSIAASTGSATFTADRWNTTTSTNEACTVSRQATGDTTNLPNIQYAMRFQRNSGQTGTTGINLINSFDSSNSIPFAGKTVTLSFYARAGANYSQTGSALSALLISGTGTDQLLTYGYTGQTNVISNSAILTTTWQRFTSSGTIASTATEIGLLFQFAPTGTAGTNDYYELTGVQIDIGSVALPFRTAGVSYQQELALCQRYYYRNTPGAVSKLLGNAVATATTSATLVGQFPVTMRTAPTALEQNATANNYAVLFGTTTTVCSAVPAVSTQTTDSLYAVTLTVASGLTLGQAGRALTDATNGATAYLGWSAEL